MNIFTASYEGTSLSDFLSRLTEAGIDVVADVREMPLSRKRGFSKTALTAALAEAGIEYRHMRALGCPKAVRDQYRQDGDWSVYSDAFLTHLSTQAEWVSTLCVLAKRHCTALLCYEADFNRCHRTYVARAAAKQIGANVAHITKEGVVKEGVGLRRGVGKKGSRLATDPGSGESFPSGT